MSSYSTLLFNPISTAPGVFATPSSADGRLKYFRGSASVGSKENGVAHNFGQSCKAISKHCPQGNTFVSYNGAPTIRWHEIVEDDIEEEALKVGASNEIKNRVELIRAMLSGMEDGEITVSAYDTAWVALIEDVNGSGNPQFPTALQWIIDNQLEDGSWGDNFAFVAHDRIINTLACVIALKRWNIHPGKCEKGIWFVQGNISKLENEEAEHMLIGFEVAFPPLIERARDLGIQVIPEDCPVLREIYAKRDLKLTRIPKDIMHQVPTTLLHSLEGMTGLDWEKLLKLQCPDGSFLFSPSSTAYALMHTKDPNCLSYLHKAVQRFNGGVPNVYPVDLFEHIWVVDRLQRLGISRYFESEVEECVDYVYRYWTEHGICWARNTLVHDIDDTAMGFRILRLNGYDVSADVLRNFETGGEFFCFRGQSTQAVTGMFNVYRASQLAFPGERILADARKFSYKFLREKQAASELLDKWIIIKDLPGEVEYALDFPWYASLPRLETRLYVEQYGGQDDVWIGKTLYRMPNVNNDMYLELAKLDYNKCQALHQLEWNSIQKWYERCNAGEFGVSKRTLLHAFFLAAASIFEPERSRERLAWTKTTILIEMIVSYFDKGETSAEQREAFIHEFINDAASKRGYKNGERWYHRNKKGDELLGTLLGTINHLSLDALVAHGRDIRRHLCQAWQMWLQSWIEEGGGGGGGDWRHGEAEIIARTINLTAGKLWVSEETFTHSQYRTVSRLTDEICRQLRQFKNPKENGNVSINGSITTPQIESDMQKLVQIVLQSSPGGIDARLKQTFLAVAKSSYYAAYCSPEQINLHIAKVLFERVA